MGHAATPHDDDDAPACEPWSRQGEILDGKFRLGEVLGRGGMGVVVAAHHLDLDEPVALKFLLPDATANRTAIERFLREARASAKLKSPHITRVFDVGRTAENMPYIVMERLRGEDLASRLRSRPFAVAEAVRIMLDVCEPLEEAHAQGVIHRDLKPQNIFLARTGTKSMVKLLDFGISRATTAEQELTRANEFLGTPHFMSPEQYEDPRNASARSDIYSLGACLYTILAQRPPFFGGDLLVLVKKVMTQPHTPIRDLRKDVPEGLARVIDRCLEKDPRARFSSAAALREALAPFAGEVPSAHLDDDTILAMQEGRLLGTKLGAVEAHLSACEQCLALVSLASPSRAQSQAIAPPSLLETSATMTHQGAATELDAATIATPRGAAGRAMATMISSENPTFHTGTLAISAASVGGVVAPIPPIRSAAFSSDRPRSATPPARNTALFVLAACLVVALIGASGIAAWKRAPKLPATAASSLPPSPELSSESPPVVAVAPPSAPIVVAATPVSAAPAASAPAVPKSTPKTLRPRHATTAPTPKIGEIPDER